MRSSFADSASVESLKDMTWSRRRNLVLLKFSRWTPWVRKGSFAILDQGLISGSNFLIGILLARWLLPEQYGAYSLAFEIFLLLSFFHQALLVEPQRVFGPSDYRDGLREYLGVLLWLHAGLTVLVFVFMGISSFLLHELARPDRLSGALAGITFAAPFILLLWLARSACYVKILPQGAAAGATVYCAIVLGGLLLLRRLGLISPFFAFLLMGFGALVSSTVILIRLKPILKLRTSRKGWGKVGDQHWEYGRWILVSFGLSSISGSIYYPLVSSFSGLVAVGELKALLNFSLPVAQVLSALSVFFLPYASRVYQENGIADLRGLSWKLTGFFGAAAIAYWTFLILLSKPVLRSLYGDHYTELTPLIPWLAVGSLPWNLAAVPAIALRAVRSPISIFRVYCASTLVAVLAGVPATWAFGIRGALLAMILSNIAALVVGLILLSRKLRNDSIGKP